MCYILIQPVPRPILTHTRMFAIIAVPHPHSPPLLSLGDLACKTVSCRLFTSNLLLTRARKGLHLVIKKRFPPFVALFFLHTPLVVRENRNRHNHCIPPPHTPASLGIPFADSGRPSLSAYRPPTPAGETESQTISQLAADEFHTSP